MESLIIEVKYDYKNYSNFFFFKGKRERNKAQEKKIDVQYSCSQLTDQSLSHHQAGISPSSLTPPSLQTKQAFCGVEYPLVGLGQLSWPCSLLSTPCRVWDWKVLDWEWALQSNIWDISVLSALFSCWIWGAALCQLLGGKLTLS